MKVKFKVKTKKGIVTHIYEVGTEAEYKGWKKRVGKKFIAWTISDFRRYGGKFGKLVSVEKVKKRKPQRRSYIQQLNRIF